MLEKYRFPVEKYHIMFCFIMTQHHNLIVFNLGCELQVQFSQYYSVLVVKLYNAITIYN